MPKVELGRVRLGITFLSGKVQAGILNEGNMTFKHKVDVHGDFLRCIVEWVGDKKVITRSDGKSYMVTCTEVKEETDGDKGVQD